MGGQGGERRVVEQILCRLCRPQGAGPADAELETAGAMIRFMDEMPGGFLIYRAGEGEKIVYANQGLLRIFQCGTMEEFLAHTGGSFRGLVHPEDLERVERSIWEQVAASRYDLDYVEYRIVRRDGAVRWIEDYGHFIHSETAGDVFYVFLGDATEKRERVQSERRRLINARLEEEHKLQSLIEEYDKERSLISQEYLRQLELIEGLSVDYESICYVDLDEDQIVPYRLSVRTSALFRGPLRDDRSYTGYHDCYVAMWVHPEDRALVARTASPEHIREKLAECRTFYFNYRVLVEGELQYLQLRVVDVSQERPGRQIVLGYRRVDDEIRRQMEQQALLAEALAKANVASTSKDAFLSNMSHDMRTPLHAIFGFTSLARLNMGDPARAAGYLDRVEAAARQLLEMIDKVLKVSDLSDASGAGEVECDLWETVREVFDFLEPQAQEKDIDFTLDCADLRHSVVYADREKLRQLIVYLTNNAVTYTEPGGRVTMSVAEGEELPNHYAAYRFTVEDTGVGISPEFLKKVFEPFSREKNTTLSGIHGIGLGLTIAKSIVDMMGGTLDVRSAVDEGSTFTATLMLRAVDRSGSAKHPPAAEDTARRILLVEDNEINREIEGELLEGLGFAIDMAENGKIAVEKLERSAPGDYDFVLMDIQMPVMDGWQASRAIRALPDPALARIPIIALSANALESDRARSRECGIDAHLGKPMDLPELLRTAEELTGKKRPG